ncbi:MAG: 23S rRNA (adenine(2503)-C(2))-methyltransferase RlmN, partial [Oscillospiraceae bacterium]|nr:23S rRNA (adenine(2503)-C(2))-methyltransferase RlmN [Oscillospiraceae bacterium]
MYDHLKSMTQQEIGLVLKELGQPQFRAKQVYTWLHKGVRSYDQMTNLPKALREVLAEKYPLHIPEVVRKQESRLDGTIKYLWKLSDGNCVETV